MLKNKTIAVVVRVFNEEKQIGMVLDSMPDFVDRIVVVNDCSTDNTEARVKAYLDKTSPTDLIIKEQSINLEKTKYNNVELVAADLIKHEDSLYTPANVINHNPDTSRVILINHVHNANLGAALATGYKWCRDHAIDCTAVMDGDGQMDPSELESVCLPIVNGEVDYVKTNRLRHPAASYVIPKIRFIGNSILSLLTKIASGYWRVSDTQSGYTAIGLSALRKLKLWDIYKRYGYPNDLFVKLNIADCTIHEVESKPVYNIGEKSKMKIFKVIPRLSVQLVRNFVKRLYSKYLFKDFHPLFMLYHASFFMFFADLHYGYKVAMSFISPPYKVTDQAFIAFVFLTISASQALFFAMWMDMMDNDKLYK
jgi:glycosyltransferase involved in cell wall biosynthesis